MLIARGSSYILEGHSKLLHQCSSVKFVKFVTVVRERHRTKVGPYFTVAYTKFQTTFSGLQICRYVTSSLDIRSVTLMQT